MNLFYIRHHYQSIIRSPSFNGEIFAFIVLAILFGGTAGSTYSQLNTYASGISLFFGYEDLNPSLFLMVYVITDLIIKLVFRRPLPRLKHYVLWCHRHKEIAGQYLVTSLFGITPFILFIPLMIVCFKTNEWLGFATSVAISIWWMANYFIGLIIQFSGRKIKTGVLVLSLIVLLLSYFLPAVELSAFFVHPVFAMLILIIVVVMARSLVMKSIELRETTEKVTKRGLLESLPVLSFKNPVFQLEWALLVRNKRTRSNLLLGLVSVLILPFVLNNETESMIRTFVFFILTGFFIIQHGVYSLGWEGSYFDFLVTNISPKVFIKTRYLFYVGTCVIGLVLASIPTILNGLNWVTLGIVFLYNVGVTIPLVLYRSTMNDTKIILTENSFMNYKGMMTGPIFVSSFLVTLMPLFIYGIGEVFLGSEAIYLPGCLGVTGVILFHRITDQIARKYQSRKYHLSQSFKA